MKKAVDFESATRSRGEDLAALAEAKEIIVAARGSHLIMPDHFSPVSNRVSNGP